MHDYTPSWDYPVIELVEVPNLDEVSRMQLLAVVERANLELTKPLGLEEGFEVFFVEPMGLSGVSGESDVLAVYCNGTSSRPVVGFDLVSMRAACEESGLSFVHQFTVSLGHELAHAFQEAAGVAGEDRDFDEDHAETFGRRWADDGHIDTSLLFDPAELRLRMRP